MCYKVAHQTPESAADHVLSLKFTQARDRARAGRLTIYKCRDCGAWHVGHSTPLGVTRRGKRARKV